MLAIGRFGEVGQDRTGSSSCSKRKNEGLQQEEHRGIVEPRSARRVSAWTSGGGEKRAARSTARGRVSGGVDVVAVGDADAALSDPFDPARLAGGKYTSACVSECVMESGTRRAERSGSHGPPGRSVIDARFSPFLSRFVVFLNPSHRVPRSLLPSLRVSASAIS